MSTTNITLSDDNLLAEYVPLEKFKGILQQRLMVSPDLLAMLIKDGQIAEASPGGHFAIGGILRTIKDAIGGRHALRLFIADLKPFQLTTSAEALTKDNVPVQGEFTIDLQVNPERPANVLGLAKDRGVVTKASLLNRLVPHLGDRVLAAAVKRVDAKELRGNVGMQDKIQADAMKEVERLASDIGLLVRAVSLRWGINEEEKAAILERQQEREQEILEREFKILNREVEREGESTVMRLQTDLNVEKVKVSTDDELRRLILSNELAFIDARETGKRIQQLEALKHELDLNRTQRLDGLKAQLEAQEHAIDLVRTNRRRRVEERGTAQDDLRDEVDQTRIRGERRGAERDVEADDARHRIDMTRIAGEQGDVERDTALRAARHTIDQARITGERGDVERDTALREAKHTVDQARVTGERRDVELDTTRREREHDLTVERIREQMRSVQRSIEDLDTRQRLALTRLEEMQKLEIAHQAHENRLKIKKGDQDIDITGEDARADIAIKTGDAAHRRAIEERRLAAEAKLAEINALRTATPEQILAINAGFSTDVANVLIEQAKSRTADGNERMQLMREMVQQARDANVATADQARTLFAAGMQGVQGVAQGVGNAVAGRGQPPAAGAGAADNMVECPGCGRKVPANERFCRGCGRQLRQ